MINRRATDRRAGDRRADGHRVPFSFRVLPARRVATPAQERLWAFLRGRGLKEEMFERELAIGPWVVDFCCRRKRVVIELDGHRAVPSERDARRDADLERRHFQVLRFQNDDVLHDVQNVLRQIQEALDHRS